jgi:hypothetical protein
MAPTVIRILETVRAGNSKTHDDNVVQFRKLPFGGRHAARDSGRVPSERGVPHITNVLNEPFFNLLNNGENYSLSGMEPRNVTLDLNETEFADTLRDFKKHPRPAHAAIPHITNRLNETYFENTLIDAKNYNIRRKQSRDIASELSEIEIYDELLNSRKLHGYLRPILACITNHLNETYFDNTLRHAKQLTGAMYASNQLNSTFNNPEPPPLDMQVQKQSTTLGLILVGVFIIVGMLLYVKSIKGSPCITWKDRSNLDMEE